MCLPQPQASSLPAWPVPTCSCGQFPWLMRRHHPDERLAAWQPGDQDLTLLLRRSDSSSA